MREMREIFRRPWGTYEVLSRGDSFQLKHICVRPGEMTSLQAHQYRAEHWVVLCGTATVTLDGQRHILSKDERVFIPVGAKHRLANLHETPLEIIELQTGTYFGEDDIIRFEDAYGRIKSSELI